MQELWKDIIFYEGYYQISNFGKVRSVKRQVQNGTCLMSVRERELNLNDNGNGYLFVRLSKEGKAKGFRVHHLVWDHFGNRARNGMKLQVDHISGKSNNRIDNLHLVTNRVNCVKYQKTQKSTSEYTGVFKFTGLDKWKASIFIDGKLKHLGHFTDELKAAEAYQTALKGIGE